jgi:hypothetical protein
MERYFSSRNASLAFSDPSTASNVLIDDSPLVQEPLLLLVWR